MSVQTRLIWDNGDLTVHSYQDVEDIIEANKRAQNADKQTGDFRKIASIPNNILLQWLNEEWARGNIDLKWSSPEFDAMIQRKLRDPDWRHLRTDK